MPIFEICISGYEEYSPVWFKKNTSKKLFRECAKKAIAFSAKKLVAEDIDGYICGDELMGGIIPLMKEMGFKVVKPSDRIDIGGECIYSSARPRPEIIDDETWKIITDYNEKIHKHIY